MSPGGEGEEVSKEKGDEPQSSAETQKNVATGNVDESQAGRRTQSPKEVDQGVKGTSWSKIPP